MKAFLLAAGFGTRLRPLTNSIPKCLVPINGKALIDYWLDAFARHGVDDVLVNLHHLAGQVQTHLAARAGRPAITTFYEPVLLGSAGTLVANKSWVEDERCFLIAYADNLTNADLSQLVAFHQRHDPLLTMALFETGRPHECGIATLDETATIVAFEEKPAHPKSTLANAGIYAVSPRIFDYLEARYPQDIGFDLLPKLAGKMKGYRLDGYIQDIGSVQRYEQAQVDARAVNFNQGRP